MKMRDHLARSLASIAGDNFADGREYWLKAADTAIRIVRHHDALVDAGIPPASVDTHPKGGDAKQAPSLMGSAVGEAETPKASKDIGGPSQ